MGALASAVLDTFVADAANKRFTVADSGLVVNEWAMPFHDGTNW